MILLLAFLASAGSFGLGAQEIRARWGLEANQAAAGQGLTLNIEVQGVDQFDPPVLTIPGVDAVWQGGGPRNSTSIVSMNGQTTRTVTKAFTGSWSLKASRPGTYQLDGFELTVQGVKIRLPALQWSVIEAKRNDAFILMQEVNPSTTILGLEVTCRITWYLGKSAQNPDFTLPLLDSPDFEFLEQPPLPAGKDQFRINYRGHELVGIKSLQSLQGQQFTTLAFEFKLRPKKTGVWDLSGTAVTFQGMVGTRKVQDFFGDVVDEPRYDTLVARAQALRLVVTDLPQTGKPGVFSGLIGKLELSWSANSGKYQVGEPIRLSLRLKGVQNKPDLDLDHMVTQALAGDDFSVVSDPDTAKADRKDKQDDQVMTRSYVFRARHGGRLMIPPLKLNYFDPEARAYGETSSGPVSLEISGSAAGQNAGGPTGTTGLLGTSDQAASSGQDLQAGFGAGDGQDLTDRGNPVNPPGLLETRLPSGAVFFVLPLCAALAGLGAAGIGWWLHSVQRRRRLRHKAWLDLCAPLGGKDSRELLSNGRERLEVMHAFLQEGGVGSADPQNQSRLERLAQEMHLWDRGYFGPLERESLASPGLATREDPDLVTAWTARWSEFTQVAKTWN